MKQTYTKRFYTPGRFLHDAIRLGLDLPHVVSAVAGLRVSRAFAEKIMLAVTQVNSCRYCYYFHTRLALRQGVSTKELGALLDTDTTRAALPEHETVALVFARHFAETGGRPGRAAMQRLRDYYGPSMSRDILTYIRVITVGNLAGNSVDAFLSRLAGWPAQGSDPLSEAVLFVLFAPFTLPLLWFMRRPRSSANTQNATKATRSTSDLHDFSIRPR